MSILLSCNKIINTHGQNHLYFTLKITYVYDVYQIHIPSYYKLLMKLLI